MNDYYRNVYDKRNIDLDVFKRFQQNGEFIKTMINAAELSKDKNFQKNEEEIQEKAKYFVNRLKFIKPFDVHKLHP